VFFLDFAINFSQDFIYHPEHSFHIN